ncbi:MAG: spondin domain-containing protein [Spirochaetota bacterium]
MKKYTWILWIIISLLLLSQCKQTTNNDEEQALIGIAYLANQQTQSDSVSYTVTFTSTWSESTHPTDFPSNPHFSGLVGAVHNSEVNFWKAGSEASTGIKNMAETGSKTSLMSEANTAITNGTALSSLSGNGISNSPGSVSLTFSVTKNFPIVTLVSMIAPSPDWFIGVHDYNLYENEEWVTNKTVNLYAYDSGTDSGTTYTSANSVTSPQETIFQLQTGIFLVNGTVPTLGTLTFVRND